MSFKCTIWTYFSTNVEQHCIHGHKISLQIYLISSYSPQEDPDSYLLIFPSVSKDVCKL